MWRIGKFIKFGILGALAIGAFGGLAMLLWNALIPEIFHGPVITYWQTLGLLVLSHVFFRGGHFGGGHRWKYEMWQRKMKDKLDAMSPEEREKFLSEWGSYGCGRGHKQKGKESPSV